MRSALKTAKSSRREEVILRVDPYLSDANVPRGTAVLLTKER